MTTTELQTCDQCGGEFAPLFGAGGLCQGCQAVPPDPKMCVGCGEEGVEYEGDLCQSCEDNTGKCGDCGDKQWLRELNEVYYRHDICTTCYQEYGTCDHCNHTIHYDNLYSCESSGGVHCEDCEEECNEEVNSNGLHEYDYTPPLTFLGTPPDSLYLGVELEIDDGDIEVVGDFQAMREHDRVFYLKEDGSLGRYGIEIVTHPATLTAHLDGTIPWERLVGLAKQYNYTSHEAQTCGLHVHLSRAGLGLDAAAQSATLSNMILFVWRHWDNVRNLSRRTNGQMHWCRPNHDAVEDFEPSKVESAKQVGRHVVLNNTNSDTIELRLFRGTLNLATLYATLQFAHHLVTYCRGKEAIDIVTGSWAGFTTDLPQELLTYLEVRQCV